MTPEEGRTRPLRLLFVCGMPASGKTFATDRVLAIEYDVLTASMDRIYRQAAAHAGIARAPDKPYGVYAVARALRTDGHLDPEVAQCFLAKFDELITRTIDRAVAWGVDVVFEGYSLKFADEVERILAAARAAPAPGVKAARVQLRPSREQWCANREAKSGRRDPISAESYERRAATPPPIPGLVDRTIGNTRELRKVAKTMRLRRHKWYQGFTAGPISVAGSSQASEKGDLILQRDVVGKRVLDVCCSTGIHAILVKHRGARKVVGIERHPARHCKSLELKKVLRRHADMDTHVSFRLGDMLAIVPDLRAFDTTAFFGALHYFSDYERALGLLAGVTRGAMYVEFAFAEGEHDTSEFPGQIRPFRRSRTGTTIYMGDPTTIAGVIERAMPGFDIEQRTPIMSPGRKLQGRREIWRLRRREP